MRRYTGPPIYGPRVRELPDREVPWFDLRLALAVHQTNEDMRMDANVKNLAGTVKEAMAALAGVPGAAFRLKAAALRVSARVDQVDEMTNDLEAADAMLALVVGQATAAPTKSNGAPPLDAAPPASPPSPPPSSASAQDVAPGEQPSPPVAEIAPAPPQVAAEQPAPQTAAQGAKVVEAANAA